MIAVMVEMVVAIAAAVIVHHAVAIPVRLDVVGLCPLVVAAQQMLIAIAVARRPRRTECSGRRPVMAVMMVEVIARWRPIVSVMMIEMVARRRTVVPIVSIMRRAERSRRRSVAAVALVAQRTVAIVLAAPAAETAVMIAAPRLAAILFARRRSLAIAVATPVVEVTVVVASPAFAAIALARRRTFAIAVAPPVAEPTLVVASPAFAAVAFAGRRLVAAAIATPVAIAAFVIAAPAVATVALARRPSIAAAIATPMIAASALAMAIAADVTIVSVPMIEIDLRHGIERIEQHGIRHGRLRKRIRRRHQPQKHQGETGHDASKPVETAPGGSKDCRVCAHDKSPSMMAFAVRPGIGLAEELRELVHGRPEAREGRRRKVIVRLG
jgi:hypothetical protein